ncbi:hypothetical protein ACFL13_02115 [Patescibacteria group bacterium]
MKHEDAFKILYQWLQKKDTAFRGGIPCDVTDPRAPAPHAFVVVIEIAGDPWPPRGINHFTVFKNKTIEIQPELNLGPI